MALEVKIEAQEAYNSLGEIVNNIKEIKAALRENITAEEFERLTEELGKAKKAFKDFNDDVKDNAAGSAFEKMGNLVSGLSGNLQNLNFEDAAGDIQNLSKTVKTFSFKDMISGFKAVTASVWQFTLALLANPMVQFALAAAALVVALGLVLNAFGLLKPALDAINDAVEKTIQYFKDLSDAIGLSNFALEDYDAKEAKNATDSDKRTKTILENLKKRREEIQKTAELEIQNAKTQEKKDQIRNKLQEDLTKLIEVQNKQLNENLDKQKGAVNSYLAVLSASKQVDPIVFDQKTFDYYVAGLEDIESISVLLKKINVELTNSEKETLDARLQNYRTSIFALRDFNLEMMDIILKEKEAKNKAEKEKQEAEKKAAAKAEENRQKRLAIENEFASELLKIQREYQSTSLKLQLDAAKKEEETLKRKLDNIKGISDRDRDNIKETNKELEKATQARIKAEEALIKESYKTRIEDNDAAIRELEQKEKTATGKSLELIRAQIAERRKINTQLVAEEKQKTDEITVNNTRAREDEQAKWQTILDNTLLNEKQKTEKQRDEDIANAYKALQQKIISQDQYNKYVEERTKETQEKINEIYKADVKQFSTSLDSNTKKLIFFSKNKLEQMRTEAKARVIQEYNDEVARINARLALIQGEGDKEKELREKLNQELIQLEKDKKDAIDKITTAQPEVTEGGILSPEGAQEINNRLRVADEFNQALSTFSEARFNREIAMAGENEALIEQAREREFKRQKAFAMANAVISGAQAVTQALTVAPPWLGVALAIATGAKVAAQLAVIKSTRYQGSSVSGGGGGVGAGGGISTPTNTTTTTTQPSFSFFGSPNSQNNLGSTGGREGTSGQNITVDVNISESEITNVQKRVARLTTAAEL